MVSCYISRTECEVWKRKLVASALTSFVLKFVVLLRPPCVCYVSLSNFYMCYPSVYTLKIIFSSFLSLFRKVRMLSIRSWMT